jgi:hypothetical protein
VKPSARDLRSLRDKYERMLALRVAHERGKRDPTYEEPPPRDAMAKLADDFPGALREIDSLPLGEIEARIASLRAAEADRANAEPWMGAQVIFHRLARGALVTKRWLRGRKRLTAATRTAFGRAVPELPRSADAKLFADDLDRVASPPRGRLMDLVHARVAETLGVTEREARLLVFGPPRR